MKFLLAVGGHSFGRSKKKRRGGEKREVGVTFRVTTDKCVRHICLKFVVFVALEQLAISEITPRSRDQTRFVRLIPQISDSVEVR